MKNKGITLISLVITIIILIILASVAIYLSLGNNGIFIKAKQAREETSKQEATDIINLKITTAQMNKYAEKQEMPTLKELSLVLKADDDIDYVTESSQISSKKYEVGENPSSIYTRLNEYPYEFEINSSLQLASIDGIKVATNEIQESNVPCNPKLLTNISMENSREEERAVGTYYANTSSYTKNNKEDFDKYLSYDETKGWIILKSGYYMIDSLLQVSSEDSRTDSFLYMQINETTFNICGSPIPLNRDGIYFNSSRTLYLEKGTIVNFYSTVKSSPAIWHAAIINIYSLFK